MSLTTFEASTVHRMSNELQSSQDGVAPKREVSVQQGCRTLEPRAFFLEFGRSMCIPAGRVLVLHVPQTIDDRHGFKFPNRFPAWHIFTLIIPIVVSLHYSTLSGGISDCTVHPHHELLGTEQVLSLPASCARMCQVLLRSRSVAAIPGSNRVDLA